MTLFYVILILLILSLCFNLGCIWYIRELLRTFKYSNQFYKDLDRSFRDLQEDITELYKGERYFGEPKLEQLLERCNDFSENVDNMIKTLDMSEEQTDAEER